MFSTEEEERHAVPFMTHVPVSLTDRSAGPAVIAVQGPASVAFLADAARRELGALGCFQTVEVRLGSSAVTVARIGYTGELGYELFVPAPAAGAARVMAIPARSARVRDVKGATVGWPTSARASPSLGRVVALGYPEGPSPPEPDLAIEGVSSPARVVALPFYDPERRRARGTPSDPD